VHKGVGEEEEMVFEGHEILLQQPFNYDPDLPIRYKWNHSGKCIEKSKYLPITEWDNLSNRIQTYRGGALVYAATCPVNGGCRLCEEEGERSYSDK
jgi:hypothetical protein